VVPRQGDAVIDKRVASLADAVAGIGDGATVLVGGFGNSGVPVALVHAVLELGVRELTIVTNNAGTGETDIAALIRERRVRKIICCTHDRQARCGSRSSGARARSSWSWCRRAR
jgi:acyl CoA:acetate/3-ketoacid CoA transferase alpha subunit